MRRVNVCQNARQIELSPLENSDYKNGKNRISHGRHTVKTVFFRGEFVTGASIPRSDHPAPQDRRQPAARRQRARFAAADRTG